MDPQHNLRVGSSVQIQGEIPGNGKMNKSDFQRRQQGKSLLSTFKIGRCNNKNLEQKTGILKCHHFSEKLICWFVSNA